MKVLTVCITGCGFASTCTKLENRHILAGMAPLRLKPQVAVKQMHHLFWKTQSAADERGINLNIRDEGVRVLPSILDVNYISSLLTVTWIYSING